jgi:hypothetical protein
MPERPETAATSATPAVDLAQGPASPLVTAEMKDNAHSPAVLCHVQACSAGQQRDTEWLFGV